MGRGVSFMATITGEKVLITDIEVFVDTDGYIHIRQEPDPSYEDTPNVVLIDRTRALAVLRALTEAVSEQASGGMSHG